MELRCQTKLLCMIFSTSCHTYLAHIWTQKTIPRSNFQVGRVIFRWKSPFRKKTACFHTTALLLCCHYLLCNMLSVAFWDCAGLLFTLWYSSIVQPATVFSPLQPCVGSWSDSPCLFLLISNDLIKTCPERKKKAVKKNQSTGQVWVIGYYTSHWLDLISVPPRALRVSCWGIKGRYGFASARVVVSVSVSWVIGDSDPIRLSQQATLCVCARLCLYSNARSHDVEVARMRAGHCR